MSHMYIIFLWCQTKHCFSLKLLIYKYFLFLLFLIINLLFLFLYKCYRSLLNFWLDLKLINLYHFIFILVCWEGWGILSIFDNLFLLIDSWNFSFNLFFFFKIINIILLYWFLYLSCNWSSCFYFSNWGFLYLFLFFRRYFYLFFFNLLFFYFFFFNLRFFYFFNWRFLYFFFFNWCFLNKFFFNLLFFHFFFFLWRTFDFSSIFWRFLNMFFRRLRLFLCSQIDSSICISLLSIFYYYWIYFVFYFFNFLR